MLAESKTNQLAAVSAVIVNFNAGNMLMDSARAALKQASQVIVVDNGSSDSSLKNLETSFNDEARLKVVRTGRNLGFATACNIGIQHCVEKYILFLNPDCILGEGSLLHMVRTLEHYPNAGMVGGLLLDPDGKEQGGGRRAMPTPWRSFVRAFGLARWSERWPKLFYDFHLHKQSLPELPIEVEAISGALMLVRREAMETVGLWDEQYFLHCEDLDWCMRFRKKGWSVLFDGGAPAIHYHGVCGAPRPVFVEYHKHRGMVRFYRKFFQHQYPGAFMWVVIAGVWIRFSWIAPVKLIKRMLEKDQDVVPIQPPQATSCSSGLYPKMPANSGMRTIAVVGASSMVGSALLPMLVESGNHVIGYSRKSRVMPTDLQEGVEWRDVASLSNGSDQEKIEDWIWLAPIKTLPQYLPLLHQAGARRIVAASTTSRFTKKESSSVEERKFVSEIIAGEDALIEWAQTNGAGWTILRPTLIYGLGLDKNIGVIARFIHRFHFFTTLGKASGLRQPIHARDVATACNLAIQRSEPANHAYSISGAEILSYREMVERIFHTMGIKPRFLSIPLWMFSAGVFVVRLLPPFRTWSSAMAERMNQDMVFDHEEAARDLGFTPQAFRLDREDLPLACR